MKLRKAQIDSNSYFPEAAKLRKLRSKLEKIINMGHQGMNWKLIEDLKEISKEMDNLENEIMRIET